MTPDQDSWWPAHVLDSWVWSLDASHFRVAFALLALAARAPTTARSPIWGVVEVPVGGVLTTLDRLADRCGVGRAVVRRALDKLAAGPGDDAAPLIRLESSARGYTLAVLINPAMFGIGSQQRTGVTTRDVGVIGEATITGEHSVITAPTQRDQESTAPPPNSQSNVADLADVARRDEHSNGHSESTARAQHDQAPDPVGGRGGSTRRSESPDLPLGDQRRTPTMSEPGDVEPRPDGRRPRLAADRVPDRAWKAADYMREQLLAAEPDNVIGKRAWSGTTGHRYQWANEFRLMNAQDGRAWDDIAWTVKWLFTGQPPEYRFRVESPASLRKKWGAIQARRQATAKPAANTKPGPAQVPLKDWTIPT